MKGDGATSVAAGFTAGLVVTATCYSLGFLLDTLAVICASWVATTVTWRILRKCE